VAKFNPSGTHLWSKRLGSTTGDESAYGVAMDGSSNVVVCGEATNAVDFGGGLLTTLGDADGFVAKYAATNGAHLWSRRVGGGTNDYCYGTAVDGSGNVFITGSFTGTATFGGTALSSAASSTDAFVAKYDAGGAPQWAKALGGTASDVGQEVAVTSTGEPVLAGYFYGSGVFGSASLTSAGLSDGFVAKTGP